jgi:hypothetical protein
MRLKISHRTEYNYDAPLSYALQRIRLTPQSGMAQTILVWNIAIEGAREELRYIDGFGNETRLLSVEGEPRSVTIVASGEVETKATTGVTGPQRGFAPLWLFEAPTALTAPGETLTALAGTVGEGDDLERLHRLDRPGDDSRGGRQARLRRVPGPRACVHRRGARARLSGTLCQRLPDEERRAGGKPCLGGSPCQGIRLGRVRPVESHVAGRDLCQPRHRA